MVLLPRLTPPLAFRRQPRLIRSSGQHSIGNVVTDSVQSARALGVLISGVQMTLAGGLPISTGSSQYCVSVATFVLAFCVQITLHPGWGKHMRGRGAKGWVTTVLGNGKVADREEV